MIPERRRLLGRRPEFDERSRCYPLRLVNELAADVDGVRSRLWRPGPFLDQGVALEIPEGWDPSGCTGFSRAHALNAEPVTYELTAMDAFALYREAQQVDEWADTPPAEGSSVIAAAKVATSLGYLSSYWWAFTLDDIKLSLSNVGPGVVGSWWKSGMWQPDARGFVSPAGANEGGHAYCLGGIIVELNAAVIYQSWGRWSIITDDTVIGHLVRLGLSRVDLPYVGLIDLDALWSLLQEDGEYCVSVDASRQPEPDPVPPEPVEPEPGEPGCLPGSKLARRLRHR